MMNYRITLLQNTQNRPASMLEVVYTFAAGPQNWQVTPIGPVQDTAVIEVECGHDLINQPGVQSRVLRAHYPTAPTTVDYPISSVQLA
jgi:hypothetical protein